jgi:hypothetical protein
MVPSFLWDCLLPLWRVDPDIWHGTGRDDMIYIYHGIMLGPRSRKPVYG